MPRVTKIAMPRESRLQTRLARATFSDAFEAELRDPSLAAAQIARRAFGSTPAWVEGLLGLRDRIVRPLGLKTVGRMAPVASAAGPPAAGDRLSIFQVESIDDSEIVLGIDDSHLDVRISFLKRHEGGRSTYAVCSLVQTHNLTGRVYMLPVGRFHPILVRVMMARAAI